MTAILLAVVLSVLLITYLIQRWRNRKIHKFMASVPGPVSIPLFGNAYFVLKINSDSKYIICSSKCTLWCRDTLTMSFILFHSLLLKYTKYKNRQLGKWMLYMRVIIIFIEFKSMRVTHKILGAKRFGVGGWTVERSGGVLTSHLTNLFQLLISQVLLFSTLSSLDALESLLILKWS